MRAPIKNQLVLDELDAIREETDWLLELDTGRSPFSSEVQLHLGEGGSTSAQFQGGKMVGLSTRFRDENNRTILVCVDLR